MSEHKKISGHPAGDYIHLHIGSTLSEAGFSEGDAVEVIPKDGYIVVVPSREEPREVCNPEDRDNIPENPLASDHEAQIVGNRLWEMGTIYGEKDMDYIENETKHLARRFHAEVNDEG